MKNNLSFISNNLPTYEGLSNRIILIQCGTPKYIVDALSDIDVVVELKSLGYDWIKKTFGNFPPIR